MVLGADAIDAMASSEKNFFFFFFFKCNRTIGSRSIGHRVWSMSLKLSEN